MSRKNSSIVSYPDSDDDNDPLHYIKKSRSRYDNAQHTQGYKNRTGKNPGYTRDSRMDGRSRDPRLQPRENNTRDPRLQSRNNDPRDHRMTFRNAESGDPRLQGKPEKDDHYEPMYNRKGRDFERENEHVAHSNSYESAGARWKQYKTEKAAEISKPDRFKSAESGWKKLKSENKWDTSNWTNQSESSDDDDGDIYNRKAPKSKIDLFSNTPDMEDSNTDDKPPTEKDFWWKYKDDDPIPNNAAPENVTVPEEKTDDLFDEILSGNLADNTKDPEKTDDISDDFLYEDVLQQSRKVLEEGKAFLGESVPESHDRNTFSRISDSGYENSAPVHGSVRSSEMKSNNGLAAQIRTDASYQSLSHTESQETKQNRNDDNYLYLSRQESQETKQNRNDGDYPYVSRRESQETKQNRNDDNYHYLSRQESQETKRLYQTEPDGLEDNGETWARSIRVEKKEESSWSDESLSPIRHDEPSPDRDVQVNLVCKRSPSRTRERSPSPLRSPSKNKRKDKESYSSLSPSRQKPSESQPVHPVVTNPYDNPKLNVDNIDRYFDDLMEWNYSHRCLICDKTFENLTKWTEHILDTKHGREFHLDPYRCPPCHDMFRNKQEWKMHMLYAPSHGFMGSINVPKPCTVLPPSPAFPAQHGWRCKSCYIVSQTDEDAFRHIKYVHLIHTAQYPCPLCGEPFWHQRDLDRHADDVHAPPKYQCDICQRAFESGEKLQTHRLIKHSKKITCYKCDKQIDELIFKEHCEMHKLEMLKCDFCGDMFKDKYHLEKHVRYDHKKYRHHHRSSSRSPDRRSSRRRSRRSSSRSRRSSSRSRRSSPRSRKVSSRDDHDRRDEKPREDPSAGEKSTEQSMKIDHGSRSQEDSSIPSSNCATPTRDEDEDIFPPGDESYRQVNVKNNSDIIEASLVNDENSRQDSEYLSPRGRRDSRETRHRSRSRERRRSRSRSYDRRSRSSRRERSRSRERYSSRRHGSYRRSRSRSRSRSHSRGRGNSRKRSTSIRDDRGLDQADDKKRSERKFVEEPSNLNNISSNTEDSYANDSKENADDEETEWERRISMKMIVKDEVWDREDDVKPDEVSQPEASKDLPIFDIPKEDDDREKPEGDGNVVENATWVVEEKPSDENKESKEESDNEEEKKQFVCKECGKALGSLMQLRDHFTVKHKKGFNLRNKRPATDIKKSQPIVEKEPKLSEEQKEIAKLIDRIE